MSTPTASSGLRDNHSRSTVAEFLREHIHPESTLSFVSAFFTVQAYAELARELDSIAHLNFLFGRPSFIADIDKDGKSHAYFKLTDSGLTPAKVLTQRAEARACAKWIHNKVDIRSIRHANFLHGKAYHIAHNDASHAILGSSNFTAPGLGLNTTPNIELNLVIDSDRDRRDLKEWFDTLWNDNELTKDVKEEVLKYLARISEPCPPQFLYYLTLYHLFKTELEGASDTDESLKTSSLYESQVWRTLYKFQRDGVKGAINKIQTYNGCILADSVGLGKTYSALAVIKYYELRNERVLVLCPKKLRENWMVYRRNDRLNPFLDDRFAYSVLSHTDLSRNSGESGEIKLKTHNWENYDLVVIDESHNFRNNSVGKTDEEGTIRRTRYQRLIEDIIQKGPKTKVLLLSATPVNNQLADLRNQISFIAGGDVFRDEKADKAFQEKLGIASISQTIKNAQTKFTLWAKKSENQRKTSDLIHELGSDFFKLLDGLTIARSRSQIKHYYSQEMERLGGFSHRNKPQSEYPHIDLSGNFPLFEELDQQIHHLNLSLYAPSNYLKTDLPSHILAEYENKMGNYTQSRRERILIGMMKVNLLKRLESSVDSFRLTLQRTIEKIDRLEEKIDRFKETRETHATIDFTNPSEADIDDLDIDAEDLEIGGKHKIQLAHICLDGWLHTVLEDRKQLATLLYAAEKVTPERDAKLARLQAIISDRVKNPTINRDGEPVRKVLVFTAFADTARYLYKNLSLWAQEHLGIHTALVCGGGDTQTSLGESKFDHILTNFSPRSKRRTEQSGFPQNEEIDLLIATDCISEGQNLQDCAFLINYDIHWNPVRIIQRFGRIDRIGSRNPSISLVNFWPTHDLDTYLNVKSRVENRMALVDISATADDNLLNNEQIDDLVTSELNYRNKQLEKLQDEIIDLEDLDENISLADFSLTDFRLELLQFLEENRAQLEAAENGLFAVVPPNLEISIAHSGILFCLRQRNEAKPTQVNPLAPYYLVYVLDDGEVRLTFMQPKQSLNLFRALAAQHATAFTDLCDAFDAETDNGRNMDAQNKLLKSALRSIKATFKKRSAKNLFSGRDGLLPKEEEIPASEEDLELITWLIIRK